MDGPLALVPEADAAHFTGRPGSTIRRWAHEGLITRHGHGRGQVKYNLYELHPRQPDGTPGAKPDKPARRAAA